MGHSSTHSRVLVETTLFLFICFGHCSNILTKFCVHDIWISLVLFTEYIRGLLVCIDDPWPRARGEERRPKRLLCTRGAQVQVSKYFYTITGIVPYFSHLGALNYQLCDWMVWPIRGGGPQNWGGGTARTSKRKSSNSLQNTNKKKWGLKGIFKRDSNIIFLPSRLSYSNSFLDT